MGTPTSISDTALIGPEYPYNSFAQLLPRAKAYISAGRFAQIKSIPENSSTVARFTRVERLDPTPIELSEGVTPNSLQITINHVDATLTEYGAYIQYTDVVADTSFKSVLNEFGPVLSQHLGEMMENLTVSELCSGINAVFSNGVERDDVNTVITTTVINSAVRALEGNYASKITSVANASTLIGTSPIPASYICFVHTDMRANVEALSNFVKVEKYGSQKAIDPMEIGSYGLVRFIANNFVQKDIDAGGTKGNMFSTGGTYADVYLCPVIARDAFGVVNHSKYGNGKMLFVSPDQASSGDPLAQRGSIGYKVYLAPKITNEAFLVRIECACSA